MSLENQTMQIIVYAGNAKSMAMAAIKAAKMGQIEEAQGKLTESREHLKIAHQHHTKILQEYAKNPEEPTNMFMTHAQDHLMSAMTANDFALEFVELYGTIDDLKATIKSLENE
ncbi:PTS lactose/cellobiose transporter subunit IIA [Carnobacterium maltaromaticum]|uniref:PTS lactose/cellobiose transporter subunit IIA n=1 Tax=Carnobacterium maltaromaticum TaxID=2751 RepID=UPI001071B609|nr:PTS lactose/cellobiose transporter subunit IIA [Carnobacterium maltaromaticum]TFJ72119.1 PTS lactose/cellobiose transporter subunit IIA [Carnobacterium maltaromaticum]TFJ77032.1 PTS lactose/cellobiose transporter subunit IIA [Carnobacterium maltaromaticum]